MADPVVIADYPPAEDVDVDMAVEETEIANTQEEEANGDDDVNAELPQQADTPARVPRFLEYVLHQRTSGLGSDSAWNSFLKSPVVEIIVGDGADQTILTAHQDLLTRSPYFEQQCAGFAAEGAVRISTTSGQPRVCAMLGDRC